MPSAPATASAVAVVGGGLAGLAAAARLAKSGHHVTLHEARDVLGGSWAPYALPGSGVLVDDAPGVLGFPAPWRDLFRKSGRPLEAELARLSYALVPAPPPVYRFADGSGLTLPSDRGEQHEALLRAYGPGAAVRWQQLVDGLADVWQALRPLGLEEAYVRGTVTRPLARRLRSRRSLADLADQVGEPHLRAIVRSIAHRQGTTPERAPALAAVDLLVDRTFGRWQVAPLPGPTGAPALGDVGRTSLLVEALMARLALRGVEVRLASRVERVDAGPTALSVRTSTGAEPADRVVLAVDPWTAAALAPADVARALRRSLRGAAPARVPTPVHTVLDPADAQDGAVDVTERVVLDAAGVPVVETRRRLGGHLVSTTLDLRRPTSAPGAGLDTAGFRGWRRRPGTTPGDDRVALAGSASPAGPGPSAVVQAGALAAYAVGARPD